MNKAEAYKILGLESSASKEDIKKQYRKLAAKHHPDVCKDAGAEEKFKQINKANDVLTKEEDQNVNQFVNQGSPFNNPFNPFAGFSNFGFEDFINSQHSSPPIASRPMLHADIVVSFKESVIGCKKEVKVQKYIACNECKGKGFVTEIKPCEQCKGARQKTTVRQTQMGSVTVRETCSACFGTGNSISKCIKCNAEGSVLQDRTMSIAVPAGIQNNQSLKLGGGGNYTQAFQGQGVYSDAIFRVVVEKDQTMKLVGANVVSKLDISLLEALEGTIKKVLTIEGEKDLVVPKMSRNNDELKIDGLGIPKHGNHLFVLDVQYPANAELLINWLKEDK